MPPLPTLLITGGGIGIGRATALAFGHAGYHVVVTDVLEAEGQAVAETIVQAGSSAEFMALDVRSSERVDTVVVSVDAARGAIDVRVLNAGIAHTVALSLQTDDRWDHTLDIDLKGMFRVARAALLAMRTGRRCASGSTVGRRSEGTRRSWNATAIEVGSGHFLLSDDGIDRPISRASCGGKRSTWRPAGSAMASCIASVCPCTGGAA